MKFISKVFSFNCIYVNGPRYETRPNVKTEIKIGGLGGLTETVITKKSSKNIHFYLKNNFIILMSLAKKKNHVNACKMRMLMQGENFKLVKRNIENRKIGNKIPR